MPRISWPPITPNSTGITFNPYISASTTEAQIQIRRAQATIERERDLRMQEQMLFGSVYNFSAGSDPAPISGADRVTQTHGEFLRELVKESKIIPGIQVLSEAERKLKGTKND